MSRPKKIAYLAPEIPALSATFVYLEIAEVARLGVEVLPISVHLPSACARDDIAEKIENSTVHLYGTTFFQHIRNNLWFMTSNARNYVVASCMLMLDLTRVLAEGPRVCFGLCYRFLVAGSLARILIDEKCSHLHAHFAHVPTDIAMYASKMSSIPFSFTAHANDIFQQAWLFKQKIQRAKFAVTISQFNSNFIRTNFIDSPKLSVVRCGVDLDKFSLKKETRDHARENLQIPIKIGSLGRLVDKKGFDILIDACAMLLKDKVKFKVEIVGDGPNRSALQHQINANNLTDNVALLGSLGHHKIPEWLETLDLFVLACKEDRNNDKDGIPVAIMEAMAAGLPVISTPISGIPELITSDISGVLTNRVSPEEIYVAMKRLAKNSAYARKLGANAREKVAAEYDITTNANLLIKLI